MSLANRYDYPIAHMFNMPVKKGEIGLEIEVEGTNLPGVADRHGDMAVAAPRNWNVVTDGSLRNVNEGDQSCEYVLNNPVSRENLDKALDDFRVAWEKAKATSYGTYRTSVHVHLNVADWPVRKLWSFLTAYFILEDALVNFADGGTKHRVGNRFCLRASDSENIITRLHTIGREDFRNLRFSREDWKYGAVSLYATNAYGSLEFRSLRGTVDVKLISQWVNILLTVKDYAFKFDDPRDIVTEFSELRSDVWCERVLGKDNVGAVRAHNPNLDQLLIFGVRNAQDVAYSCDWKKYVEPKVKTKTEEVARQSGTATFRIRPTATATYGIRITTT